MNKIEFYPYTFLTKKDIKPGHVYIKKEGVLILYIGKDAWDRFVFYDLAAVMFSAAENPKRTALTLANYDLQKDYLINLCNSVIEAPSWEPAHVLIVKTLPSIYAEFPYVNYENTYEAYYNKNRNLHKKLPEIQMNQVKADVFVKAKDLVPGELYYSGSLWRSLYLYLGRDDDKNFCWYFVGNVDILKENNLTVYKQRCDRLKNNKKVKKLSVAMHDPDAYVDIEVKELIDSNWKANLSGLDL